MVQGKEEKVNYKLKKRIHKPRDEWICVPSQTLISLKTIPFSCSSPILCLLHPRDLFFVWQMYSPAKWAAVSVKRILENPVYTGTMVQGKEEKVNYSFL